MLIISNAKAAGTNPLYPLFFRKNSRTARVASVRLPPQWKFAYLLWGLVNLTTTIAAIVFFENYISDTDVLALSILAMAATKIMMTRVYIIELSGAVFSPATPILTMEFVVHFFALAAGAVLASYQLTGNMAGISILLACLAAAIGTLPILNLLYVKLYWRRTKNWVTYR